VLRSRRICLAGLNHSRHTRLTATTSRWSLPLSIMLQNYDGSSAGPHRAIPRQQAQHGKRQESMASCAALAARATIASARNEPLMLALITTGCMYQADSVRKVLMHLRPLRCLLVSQFAAFLNNA